MKDRAIKAGYVNFGYFAPDASTNDEYPAYIEKNVSEAIDKIKSYQTPDTVTFSFMTDIHYSKTDVHDLRMKRLLNAYKNISEGVASNLLFLGGDYVNNGNKEYSRKNFILLREHLWGIKYFPANGNHDDNSFWDEYIGTKATNHHTQEEMYNLFYSHLPALGAQHGQENSLYYYLDDKAARVRYIVLDTCDVPEIYTEEGSLLYAKQHTFAISRAQTDWLINTALKVAQNTDVVIIAHNPPLPSSAQALKDDRCTQTTYTEMKNMVFLNDILDAYNKKTAVSICYGEGVFKVCAEADFSSYNGSLLAVLGGHHHRDMCEISGSGVPYIYCDCTAMYNYPTPRIDGDRSELLFDVVTIDKKSKKIYMTRIGAGEDRII